MIRFLEKFFKLLVWLREVYVWSTEGDGLDFDDRTLILMWTE